MQIMRHLVSIDYAHRISFLIKYHIKIEANIHLFKLNKISVRHFLTHCMHRFRSDSNSSLMCMYIHEMKWIQIKMHEKNLLNLTHLWGAERDAVHRRFILIQLREEKKTCNGQRECVAVWLCCWCFCTLKQTHSFGRIALHAYASYS